jgi:hypothetical protein
MKRDKLETLKIMKKLTLFCFILCLIAFSLGIILDKRIDKGLFLAMIAMLFSYLYSRQADIKKINLQLMDNRKK